MDEKHVSLKNDLNSIFQKNMAWFFYLQLAITAVELTKMTFIYTYFQFYQNEALIYGQVSFSTFGTALNFLFMPELAPVTINNVFAFADYWRMGANLLIFSLFLYIFVKTEKEYIQIFEENVDEVQLFLFTLSVKGFKDIPEAEAFVEIIKMQHPTDDIVVEETFVYDLDNYRKARQVSNDFDLYLTHLDKSPQENMETSVLVDDHALEDKQQLPSVLSGESLLKSKSIFTGKLFIVLNDLHVMRSILQLYESGLLLEKVKLDIEKACRTRMISEEKAQLLQITAKACIPKLKIEVAHDVTDINFRNIEKDQFLQNVFKLFLCLLVFGIMFVAVFALKYFATGASLNVQFGVTAPDLQFIVMGSTVKISIASFFENFALVIVPIIGTFLIQLMISNIRFHHHSSAINASFLIEALYQLIHQFFAIYLGYKQAVFNFRDSIDPSLYPALFYDANWNFSTTGALVFAGTWVRYLLMMIVQRIKNGCKRRNIQGATVKPKVEDDDSLEFIEHSFFAVNIVMSYFYLFFYQSLMSPAILIVLTAFLLMNMAFFNRELQSKNRKRAYLSFDHIGTFVCFVLFVGSLGSGLATIIQLDFSFPHFTVIGYTDDFFPLSVVTAVGVLLIYLPVLIKIKSHSAFSMRIIEYMIDKQLHVTKMEKVEEVSRDCGFRSFNSWDQARSDLNQRVRI